MASGATPPSELNKRPQRSRGLCITDETLLFEMYDDMLGNVEPGPEQPNGAHGQQQQQVARKRARTSIFGVTYAELSDDEDKGLLDLEETRDEDAHTAEAVR